MNQTQWQQHPRLVGLLAAIATVPLMFNATNAQAQNWSTIEQNIIAEQNRVRQHPQSYIPLLEARLASMDANGNIPNGCGPRCTLHTQEGQAAVREAIAFLRNQPALAPVTLSTGAAQSAKDHAQDQASGAIGHNGSNGSSPDQRIRQQVDNPMGTGENIAYGARTGQEVVLGLIIDDGVPDRGHRTNIFDADWTHAGAGCGPHARYRTVCVINYFTERANQLSVVNNGTVPLQFLKIGEIDILGGVLAPGQSRDIPLTRNQCEADVTIQLGGGYSPFNWPNRTLCGATLTITEANALSIVY
ncbi:MAG: CAP domain-containing protein [Leptolyngbyaceae cyanobacterium]